MPSWPPQQMRWLVRSLWTSRWRSRTHRQQSGSEPVSSSPLHSASCSPSVTFRIQEGTGLPFWGQPQQNSLEFPLHPLLVPSPRLDQPRRMNSQLTLCLDSWPIVTKLGDPGKGSPAVLLRGLHRQQKLRAPALTRIPVASLPHLAFWLCVSLLTCPD